MKLIRRPDTLRAVTRRFRRQKLQIGFVPTMGALHEGHLALVRRARRDNDRVIVSIFVNPLQFGPGEDLKKYPRQLAQDARHLRREKTDILFSPPADAMYDRDFATVVDPGGSEAGRSLTSVLCGRFRPGHFRGVCTVVLKLLELTQPDRVYFGAKDYQQGIVVNRMIRDLNLPVRFVLCPTVREKDGLAMSSRNAYLSASDRKQASGLSRTLFELRDAVRENGRMMPAGILRRGLKMLAARVGRVQYLELLDPETLTPLRRRQPRMLLAAACFVGKTRLIDNVIIRG